MSITEHNEAAQELAETFSFLDDWEDRYRFIIDLGKELPPMDDSLKVEANRVHGCQATVYLYPQVRDGDEPVLDFIAQSDAAIVNGLIAILQRVYSGQTPAQIVNFDIEAYLRTLDLNEHLSPTRRNGLYEMVKRIRTIAQAYVDNNPAQNASS